jgi:hypothetical protein
MLRFSAERLDQGSARDMSDVIESTTLRLKDFMSSSEGWGREQGREVYNKLLRFVEGRPGTILFRVSVRDVSRVDISFASETIVELARRYRGSKGFAFIDLDDPDMLENWEAAAAKKNQPLMVWKGADGRAIGIEPSQGTVEAFQFALARPRSRAAEFVKAMPTVSIANASTKFKQLWEQGFLLRRENIAESGGVEYVYLRIGGPIA